MTQFFKPRLVEITALGVVALIACIVIPARAADPSDQNKPATSPKGEGYRVQEEVLIGKQAKPAAADIEIMSKNLEAVQQALKHRDEQIAQLIKQLEGQQRKPSLPPLENAQ